MNLKHEELDDFFDDVYTTARGGTTTINEFRSHPNKIVDTFKKFIFHDPAFGDLDINVQNAIQACITTICNRF